MIRIASHCAFRQICKPRQTSIASFCTSTSPTSNSSSESSSSSNSQNGSTTSQTDSRGRDIAFKPNDSGWGYNDQYANKFDSIFGGKSKK